MGVIVSSESLFTNLSSTYNCRNARLFRYPFSTSMKSLHVNGQYALCNLLSMASAAPATRFNGNPISSNACWTFRSFLAYWCPALYNVWLPLSWIRSSLVKNLSDIRCPPSIYAFRLAWTSRWPNPSPSLWKCPAEDWMADLILTQWLSILPSNQKDGNEMVVASPIK